MEAYDSAYNEDDVRERRNAINQARLKETGECDKCGGELKVSKRGNLYCAKVCWVKEEA